MGTLYDLYVRVLGDKSDVDKTIRQVRADGERLGREKFNFKVGADTKQAEAQVKALQSTLADLQKKAVNIPIRASRIDADIEQAKRKLAELNRERIRVPIGGDTTKLDAEIRKTELALTRLDRRKVDIPVTLERASFEIAAVEAQLAGLEHKRINIPVNIDTDKIGAASTRFAGLLRIPALASGVGLAGGGIAALAGGLTAVTAAAAPAVGALGAVSGAALAAGQGAGVGAIAFVGLGDAMKAMSAADTASSSSAKASAAARMAAAEAVRQAQSGLADAVRSQQRTEVDGARSVRDAVANVASARQAAAAGVASAEKSLAAARVSAGQRTLAAEKSLEAAQRTSKAAQLDLTSARKDAVRQIEDLKTSLKGAANSEEDAQISLLRAQERLTASLRAGSGASALDIREARAGVADAQLSLVEVRQRHADIARQVADANKAGVEGAANVVAARQKVIDAQGRERDAAKHVRDAQVQGAAQIRSAIQAVSDAQVKGAQRVAKAQESESVARMQAARANQDAARQTAAAQHAVAIAQAQAGLAMEKQTSQAAALAEAMANISPKARIFARYLHNDVIPALRGLQFAVQDAFFPPFQDAVKRTTSLLPIFTKGLVGTAKVLGDVATKGAEMITSGPWRRDFATLMAGNNRVLRIFGDAALPLVGILKDLAVAALPLTERFARFVDRAAHLAAAFIHAKREGGQLSHFFQVAGDAMAELGRIGGNLIGAFFNIGKAGYDAGKGLTDSFEKATGKFKDLTGSASGQNRLRAYFENSADATRAFGRLVNDIGRELLHLGSNKSLAPLIEQIRTQLLPAINGILDNLTGDFGSKIVSLFTSLAGVVQRLSADGGGLSSFVDTLRGMADGFKKILDSGAGPVINDLFKFAGVAAALGLAVGPLTSIAKGLGLLGKVLAPLGGVVRGVAAALAGGEGLAGVLAALGGPVTVAVAAVAAIGIAAIIAYKKSETFRDAVNKFASTLKRNLQPAWDAIVKTWREDVLPSLQDLWAEIKKAAPPILRIASVVGAMQLKWLEFESSIAGKVIPIIAKLVGFAFKLIIKGLENQIRVAGLVARAFVAVFTGVAKVVLFASDKILAGVEAVTGALSKIPGPMQRTFRAAHESAVNMRKGINRELDKINSKTVQVGVKLSADAKSAIAAFGPRAVVSNGKLVGIKYPGGTQRLATGGAVGSGYGSRDDVPALLTRGEHVLTTREVKAAGGHAGVEALRASLRERQHLAKGGPVGVATDFPDSAHRRLPAQLLSRVRDRVGQALLSGLSQGVAMGVAATAGAGAGAGAPDPSGAYTFPLPRGSYRVGMPLNGYRGHTGQDFPVPSGTPTFAPFAGMLTTKALGNRSYGNMASITAGSMRYIAGHLQRFARGNGPVARGDLIGFTDSTGNSTGPHLHAEFRRNGRVINPRSVLSYDRGGLLYPGQLGGNFGPRGGSPERVLTPKQNDSFERAIPILERIADNGGGGGTLVQNITLPNRRTAIEVGRAANRALEYGWSG